MPTGTPLTDGEVRSVFSLRSEGKRVKDIAEIMALPSSTVSRVLSRKTYPNVHINQNVLDRIVKMNKPSRKRPRKNGRVKDTRKGVTLDDLGLVPPQNPAMPQAMKDADPAYAKSVPKGMSEDLRTPPVHRITKAQAMTDVLALVSDGNEARARVRSLVKQVQDMEKQAKCYEDKAFAKITQLGNMGFDPEFLNAFISECGLCTDGYFDTE